jgi:hypothetical protein
MHVNPKNLITRQSPKYCITTALYSYYNYNNIISRAVTVQRRLGFKIIYIFM